MNLSTKHSFFIKPILLLCSLSLFASGCYPIYQAERHKIVVEEDNIKKSQRIKKLFFYRRATERFSPLDYIDQTILKEITNNHLPQYTVHEKLVLELVPNTMTDTVFLIVDDVPYPLAIQQQRVNYTLDISEGEGISVATDTETHTLSIDSEETEERKTTLFLHYTIPLSIISTISKAETISFRYYMRPHMMTTHMTPANVKKLKTMIEMK